MSLIKSDKYTFKLKCYSLFFHKFCLSENPTKSVMISTNILSSKAVFNIGNKYNSILECFLKERDIEDWCNGCWKFSFCCTGIIYIKFY